ncbi:Tm-1-like ATP-binding domain-containing protein [Cucumibacter marinus]|uniref:Tm-1-like ATP-binding domain-containing protein n=1 Tax=Cucumibacter marinus TaxID=1121252 RepID=UPI000423CD47|nr:Tm-1-like ATP-binding domain-containing protein [Cucumibacter marinus]
MTDRNRADDKTILVIGTYDTKSEELTYLASRIEAEGGTVMAMDVSVLGEPASPVEISKHDVAEAGGSSIEAAIATGLENEAMQIMARGASAMAAKLHREGRIHGMIALGGTMGTDLALDVANTLPMGVPKYVVSTVAFSPLIPTERLAPDLQMILWAGGLYGLNSVCKSSLSQAAGAVLGAARAVEPPQRDRPIIGMTSLGSSCLSYMVKLKPELEKRGFELAVFHATGMGGRAFEALAAEGAFACVMDFAMSEFGNLIHGTVVNSGESRLTNAGRAGVPQIVAPGCVDLADVAAWQPVATKWSDREMYPHNRLLGCITLTGEERGETARQIADRLSKAKGPTYFILPNKGVEEWDREGGEAHDPEALDAFMSAARTNILPNVPSVEIDAHINDQAFVDKVLEIFDGWIADGTVKTGSRAG